MAIDNVTFRFRIDTAKAEQTLRQLEATVKRLGGSAIKTSQDMGNLNTKVSQTGNNAAASAVNFQTATNGMLNLSTASVQTFTSISNLDRANNRAKMSVIAVARAEDLLANKIERQNSMRKAGEVGSQKYLNITKEIATAEADLTVKKEKMTIEQAAVNDVYMLFVTNIANVVVSSFQTISILNQQVALTTKIKTAALKIHEAATWSNIRSQAAHIKSTVAMNITTKIGTAITLGYAGSIKAATVAMKAFAVSHPALIAATAVMTGLLIAYEANVLNLKDAINSLLPKQESFKDGVDEARDSVGKFDEDLEKLGDTVKVNFARSLEDATSVALAFRLQIDRINDGMGKMNANIQRDLSQGQQLQQWTESVVQYHNLPPQKKTKNFFKQLGEFFTPVLTSFAEEQPAQFAQLQRGTIFAPSQFDIPPPEVIDSTFGLPAGTIAAGIRAGQFTLQQATDAYYAEKGRDPMEFLQQQELLRAQKQARALSPAVQEAMKKVKEVVPLREQLQAIRIQQLVTDKRDPLVGQMRETGIPQLDKRLFQLGLLKGEPAENIKKTLENRLFGGVGRISEDQFEKVKLAQTLEAGPLLDAVDFAGITDLEDEVTKTQYVRLLAAKKGVGGSFTLTGKEQSILDKISKGLIKGKRAEVLIRTGEDIGAVANSIDIDSGLRLGALQESQRQFNRTSADPFVSDFDRLGGATRTFSDVLRSSSLETQRASVYNIPGIGGRADQAISALTKAGTDYRKMQVEHALGGMEFGAGFFKSAGATAAYQVPRGSIRASDDFYRRIAIRDANTNRLRFGGKLRDGMSIYDEDAVIGGYGSRKAQSDASKRRRSLALEEAQRFMFGFGFTGIKRYTGLSDLRGQLNNIARQAHERRTALESAGLGYKSFNINGLRYRHTRAERNAYERERQSTLAFNNNQYAKAGLINMLEQDFGAKGFVGSALSLSSLQDEVAKQDELIKSIGLDRTEAFQIVDTAGRGREEIDDRIRFKDRMSSMSTGVSVL